LSPTIIFDYPTPAALSRYLHEQIGGEIQQNPTLDDDEIREIIRAIPLSRLRDKGMLSAILALADSGQAAQTAPTNAPMSIDDMDVEALIQHVTEASSYLD
jgi:predicted transcriptional regulator